jgi:dipeptidase E
MQDRHVVAMGGGGFSMDDHGLDRFAVDLTGATRPKICFLPTASGDALSYILRFYEAFPSRAFDTSVLRLFERDVADVGAFLGGQDLVYVGGGNTASMLAIWRLHGVDLALRAAWDAGLDHRFLPPGASGSVAGRAGSRARLVHPPLRWRSVASPFAAGVRG